MMNDKLQNKPEPAEFLLYQTEDGQTRLEVRLQEETVWLSQKMLADLFQKDVRTINEHIKNIDAEGELEPQSTIRKFRMVQTEGKRKVSHHVDSYNLDVIISVGYRVKSHRGHPAPARIVKRFAMGDDLLAGTAHVTPFLTESQEGGT